MANARPFSGVSEDSKSLTLEVLGFTPTLGQSGVATLCLNINMLFQRIILGKINHGNNLILCQIIQARLELGILPLGFKIVNKKLNQFKL
jgi:hypothetical protein